MLKFNHPLREYQQDAFDFLMASQGNPLIQMPCRTGKTAVLAHAVASTQDARTLILAPNLNLVHNIFKYFDSPKVALYLSGMPYPDNANVVISTYELGKKILDRNWDKIFFDEAHRSVADGMLKSLEASSAKIYGFTASPNRLDDKPLNKNFQSLFLSPPLRWFIDRGYVADFDLIAPKPPEFLSSDGTDDIQGQSDIFAREEYVESLVQLYDENYPSASGIVFATTVEHGQKIVKKFEEFGYSVAFASHKTPKKELLQILDDYDKGVYQILVNVQLFTEGIDIKICEVVVLARFTFSSALYIQMVMRPFTSNGEKRAKILDMVGNVYYHGTPDLDFPWSLESWAIPKDARSNTQTLRHICVSCEVPLFTKSQVPFDPGVYEICCINCQQQQSFVVLPTQKNAGASRAKAEAFLDPSQIQRLDNGSITEITRTVLNPKQKPDVKIRKIVGMSIPKDVKLNCMRYLGISEKKIRIYLDD